MGSVNIGNKSEVKPERPRELQCPGESFEGLVSNSRNGEKWLKESWICGWSQWFL